MLGKSKQEVRECPECGKLKARKVMREDRFQYGIENPVELIVTVPVWTCECGFAFTDGEAEVLHHEAICRHLGVLTPGEIRRLRMRHRLSREELARLTGFGTASIKRWERGVFVQNTSADRFLRLIDDAEVLEKLRQIAAQ